MVYCLQMATTDPGEAKVAPVITETRESLLARREALLRRLGVAREDEFDRLSASRTLTGDEVDARDELDEIAFLLGGER